jgi:hypothetical protein
MAEMAYVTSEMCQGFERPENRDERKRGRPRFRTDIVLSLLNGVSYRHGDKKQSRRLGCKIRVPFEK